MNEANDHPDLLGALGGPALVIAGLIVPAIMDRQSAWGKLTVITAGLL